MLPTPPTSHVNYNLIYEPAEDSFLLLDTLSSPSETTFLASRFPADSPSPLITEIGTGSGVVLAFANTHAAQIFGRSDVLTLGVDISRFACEATEQTVARAAKESKEQEEDDRAGRAHGVFLDALNGDLATALRLHQVDVLLFNPPYVPAPLPAWEHHTTHNAVRDGKTTFEQESYLLELTYAGGEDGMVVTHRLLDDISRLLSERGVAYVLLCAQNKPDEVMQKIRSSDGGWRAEIVGKSGKVAGWEKLVIVRIWKTA